MNDTTLASVPEEEREKPEQQKKDHPYYRGGTLNAIEVLLEAVQDTNDVDALMEKIRIDEQAQSRVSYLVEEGDERNYGDLQITRPADIDRRNSILLSELEEGLNKGDLAKYYHISPQHLSMLIHPNYANRVKRDLIISAVLLPRLPVSVDKLNHILMEVNRAGIYDKTGDVRENRRNRVLMELVNYAQDHECPRDRWLTFAHEVLAYLRLPPLYRDGENHHTHNLTPKEIELIEQWGSWQPRDDGAGYLKFRRECFDAYCARHGLNSAAAHARIARKCFIGEDSVRSILCSGVESNRNRGGRETLVLMAIELGRGMDEANRILMEAGYPVLYPFRENPKEVEWILKLLRNQICNR